MKEGLTVDQLRQNATNIKFELDKLERAAYGMTFDELIRLLGTKDEKPMDTKKG